MSAEDVFGVSLSADDSKQKLSAHNTAPMPSSRKDGNGDDHKEVSLGFFHIVFSNH